ncbi:hypothetical protein ACJW31_02G139800 [Castanea mollissima]
MSEGGSQFFELKIEPVSFQITRFDPTASNVIYQGDAIPFTGTIEMNSATYLCHVGMATYAEKVPLWDSKSGDLANFKTHFSFTIDTQGHLNYGNGTSFFLAPVEFQIPPNSIGGFLGLYNTTFSDSPKNQIVHVEFDSYANTKWDPNITHVGINNNSIHSSVYTTWDPSFHSGHTADVWIIYNASTKNLSVSWNYQTTSNPEETISLSYQIDLRKVLLEWVTIDFLAATCLNIEQHILKSWEINSNLDISTSFGNEAKKQRLIVVLTVSGGVLIARGKKKERAALAKRFSYNDLVSATNSFLDERKLGQGGFGAVYKGYLTQLDMLIAFLLVYEFMPNGSLETHLFGERTPFTWEVRYKISIGLTSALFYLHEEWEQCVVHRDIKASNVMLDSSLNVKLDDFGLARLMDHELGPQTTGVAGTFGYMDPEYIRIGEASKESNVYSFGSFDPAQKDSEMGLLEWIWNLYAKGDLLSAVDEKLLTGFDEKQVECLLIIGLWCSHPNRNMRSSIRQAIQVLKFEATMPNLPTDIPFQMYRVTLATAISGNIVSTSTNLQQRR